MKYVSTRGNGRTLAFEDVLLTGLAADGGLYVPERWPGFDPGDLRVLASRSYAECAFSIIRPFVGGVIDDRALECMAEEAYAQFDHPAVAPLRQIDRNDWLLELFHGPTLAFKDFALQLLGRMFDHVLARRRDRVTVVGATSGDTGSAAIEACRGRENVDIFVLFPKGRVSDIQRLQMTTVGEENVHALAIEGTFDDCQDLVKALFNDVSFRAAHKLSAFNSINWARVMIQIVYYIVAAVRIGAPDRRVSFAVPTGNFGNVLAGWAAWKTGLPVEKLVIGTNRNDILFRFFETGTMEMAKVAPTISPSMDIQIASNFERLLYDMYDRDSAAVGHWMEEFRRNGRCDVDDARLQGARRKFAASRLDDEGTRQTMRQVFESTGTLIDPHTAVGVEAARTCREDSDVPMLCLATAHPAKFPEAVEEATGLRPSLPSRLAGLEERQECFSVLPPSLSEIQDHIRRAGRSVS